MLSERPSAPTAVRYWSSQNAMFSMVPWTMRLLLAEVGLNPKVTHSVGGQRRLRGASKRRLE